MLSLAWMLWYLGLFIAWMSLMGIGLDDLGLVIPKLKSFYIDYIPFCHIIYIAGLKTLVVERWLLYLRLSHLGLLLVVASTLGLAWYLQR
jgi:hypothetical protein